MSQFIENDFAWERGPLEKFFRFTKKPKELRIEDGATMPFIPMELVPEKGQTNTPYNLKKYDDVTSGTYFEDGDILVAKITPSFENGKQGIANLKDVGFGYATTEVIPIHEIEELSNRYYLFYYLLDPLLRNELASKMEGSTGRKRVRDHLLKELIIDIPRLSEQLCIAAILHKIQRAIEVETKLAQTTHELKKSTMKQLFTHGLRGEKLKETEIGLVPESWEIRNISDISDIQPGYAFKSQDYTKKGIRVFRISNVSFGHADWSDVTYLPEYFLVRNSEYVLNPGDLIMAMTRPIVQGGIKVTLLKDADCPALLNQRVCRFIVNANASHDFLFQILFNPIFISSIVQNAIGSQQPNISASKIGLIKVPLPPIVEQQQIAHILQTIDQKIEIHEKKKSTLQDLFKTMLHKLMTAEIRVHDLDIDTSEVV